MTERRKRLRSGETLVEALVGIFIFLIILAVLQGAVSFCTNAQRESEEIRERNADICRNLRGTAYTAGTGTEKLVFAAVAIDPDTGRPITDPSTGQPITSEKLFEVEVNLGTKNVEYVEEGANKNILFYLFGGTRSGTSGGGGTEPGTGGEDP